VKVVGRDRIELPIRGFSEQRGEFLVPIIQSVTETPVAIIAPTSPPFEEQTALQELETILKPRIETVNRGQFSTKFDDSIFDEAEQEENRK
jgi:hypothetical protein